jgi:hypothetical protein
MSQSTYVPEQELRQQADATLITTANADLHRRPKDTDRNADEDRGPHARRVDHAVLARSEIAAAARAADLARSSPAPRAWPFNPEDTFPLAWWRTLPANLFRDAEALLVSATLDKIDVLSGSHTFAAALRGDTAAAITTALALMPIEETTLEVDLAMTAVLRGALDGDAAAALVLSHVIGRATLHHPFATELSPSWLAHHLRHSPNRRCFTEEEARLWSALRAQDEATAAGRGDQP